MDVSKSIRYRRSIRKYKNKFIEKNDVAEILEAGRWAPSGLNNQPWKFKVITDPKIKEELSTYTQYDTIIKGAPLCICVFLDNSVTYSREKDIMAIGACIQNMLLKSTEKGIGSCWLGEILIKKEEVGRYLELYPSLELMAVIAFGYPDENGEESERKSLKELIIDQSSF